MKRVFIDGAAGTTGQKIGAILKPLVSSGQIELVTARDRKDPAARLEAFEAADASVLCLHDDVARETVAMLGARDVRLVDASSAHRVSEGWVYGFPELSLEQPRLIAQANRVSNPGCYATAAVSLLRPLTDAGLVARDSLITITGASGYTGGGNAMIEKHEQGGRDYALSNVFSVYSLGGQHKHVPEMMRYGGLSVPPVFLPAVLNVPRGIMVNIALRDLAPRDVQDVYERAYASPSSRVRVSPFEPASARIDYTKFLHLNKPESDALPDDDVELHVRGWTENGVKQVSVHALLDNLGKGAASQAVQNLKLMLGI